MHQRLTYQYLTSVFLKIAPKNAWQKVVYNSLWADPNLLRYLYWANRGSSLDLSEKVCWPLLRYQTSFAFIYLFFCSKHLENMQLLSLCEELIYIYFLFLHEPKKYIFI